MKISLDTSDESLIYKFIISKNNVLYDCWIKFFFQEGVYLVININKNNKLNYTFINETYEVNKLLGSVDVTSGHINRFLFKRIRLGYQFNINGEILNINTKKIIHWIDYCQNIDIELSFRHQPIIKEKKLLSFAITCLNRFSQLKKTLKRNLLDNRDIQIISEFVIIDFGTPNLSEFIFSNFKNELKSGYLKYVIDTSLKKWHASVAKNKAYSHCQGEYITNLDCDNYIGKYGGLHILKYFEKVGQDILLHQWSGTAKDGTYGRITCKKKNFEILGGYDESFYPMGYQDHDFIMRYILVWGQSKYINYQIFKHGNWFKKYCQAIKNDKIQSIENTNLHGKLSWYEMNELNKQKSISNLKRGIFKVN